MLKYYYRKYRLNNLNSRCTLLVLQLNAQRYNWLHMKEIKVETKFNGTNCDYR